MTAAQPVGFAAGGNFEHRENPDLRAMVRCALRPDLSAAMRDHAWGLIRQWPSPSPRDPVHGDWRPIASRPAEEARAVLQEMLPKIREHGAEGAVGGREFVSDLGSLGHGLFP